MPISGQQHDDVAGMRYDAPSAIVRINIATALKRINLSNNFIRMRASIIDSTTLVGRHHARCLMMLADALFSADDAGRRGGARGGSPTRAIIATRYH